MTIKLLPESKIDSLLERDYGEFEDDSPGAEKWESLREELHRYLCQFSHDEEAEDADGSPGFLLQDQHDNAKTLGMEFNDDALISRRVVEALATILENTAPDFGICIRVMLEDDMQYVVIHKGVIHVPKTRALKARFTE